MPRQNNLLAALESVGEPALVSVTVSYDASAASRGGLPAEIQAEIMARSALQEKAQRCVTISTRPELVIGGSPIVHLTAEVVVMTKDTWTRMLSAVYRAGHERSSPPLQEPPHAD